MSTKDNKLLKKDIENCLECGLNADTVKSLFDLFYSSKKKRNKL